MRDQPRWLVVAAFGAIYFFWGSAYLFIRFAIETIPPLLMSGAQHVAAGALLYAWAHRRGSAPPERFHWMAAAITGALMILIGVGGLAWGEQRVASGLAALLIATDALWIVVLDWLSGGSARPGKAVWAGMLFGIAGIALLAAPGEIAGGGQVDVTGAAVLLLASFSWAAGSIYSRRARLPASLHLTTAMQMLLGGAMQIVAGLALGEWARLEISRVSLLSLLSLGYLVVFGSVLGFTAYIWLLRVTTAARVSTYAYVNPIVAVFLGWAVASEPLNLRTLLAAAVIVTAVVLAITYRERRTA